jgi:group I intron endonuclease
MNTKEQLKEKFKDKGEIYMLIAPNDERYIGQTKCYYNFNDILIKKGLNSRWKAHINYSKNNDTLLSKSIKKYGAHNFKTKILLICDISQLNYFEVKYIRQNKTYGNGLNMTKGGSIKSGLGNPTLGTHLSDETKQKIREALTGKILPQNVKDNMSKSHKENMINGNLPPRRIHNLPKYIYHVISSNKDGYEIRNHPILKQKQFVSKQMTMEENLNRAIEYLKDTTTTINKKVIIESKKYENLPRFVRQIDNERYIGFEVKNHPTLKNKKWTNMKLSIDEKLKLVKDYLLTEKTQRLNENGE